MYVNFPLFVILYPCRLEFFYGYIKLQCIEITLFCRIHRLNVKYHSNGRCIIF